MNLQPQKWTKKTANEKILEIINNPTTVFNKDFNIKMFRELIHQCDVNIKNKEGNNLLIYLLFYNNTKEYHLKQNEIYDLLNKGNLNQTNNQTRTVLFFLFLQNKTSNLEFSKQQIKTLWEKCSKTNQRLTFKNLVDFHQQYLFINNQKEEVNFQEEIQFLLYDCQLDITKEMIHRFKNQNKLEIIEMIEKRNLFLKVSAHVDVLENELKNHQTIKKTMKV